MNALKAQWVVRAGLIPGDAMDDYSRAWSYTSNDYTADGGKRGERFTKADKEAHEWAGKLRDGGLNWVTLEYMWM